VIARFSSRLESKLGTDSRFVLPLALIVAMALLVCAGSILALVERLDWTAAAQNRATIQGALNSALADEADSARENGRWDEAVAHLYSPFDYAWANRTISASGITYVLDDRGGTLFAERADGSIDPPLDKAAPEGLKLLLARLPKQAAGANRMKTGVSLVASYRGAPAIISAMPIVPLKGATSTALPRLHYIAYVTPIDAKLMAQWGKNFGLTNVQVRSPDAGGKSVPVIGADGRALASIQWLAERAGRRAFGAIAPFLGLAFLALGGLAVWLMRGLRRQALDLVRVSNEHRREADAASIARAEAETARACAEAARASAEAAADREAESRRQHAQELRSASRMIGQSLKGAMRELTDQLERSAESLDDSADRTSHAVRAQQEQMEQIRSRMAATASSLRDMEQQIRTFTQAIKVIGTAAQEAERDVNVAALRSSESGATSVELVRQLAEIEKASGLIGSIASETNMLALNAAIEASRSAGNSSGFAVVAAEVKALARRAGAAADEITHQLRDIASCGQSSARMSEQVHLLLEDVHKAIAHTSSAADRQGIASGAINLSIGRVGEEADEMALAVDLVTQSAEHIVATAVATREISADVRTRSHMLKQRLEAAIEELLAA